MHPKGGSLGFLNHQQYEILLIRIDPYINQPCKIAWFILCSCCWWMSWGLPSLHPIAGWNPDQESWAGFSALIPRWVFPKIGVPQNGWFIMKTLLKLMIWGYHYIWKHPYHPCKMHPCKSKSAIYVEHPMNKLMIWGYPYFWKHPDRVYTLNLARLRIAIFPNVRSFELIVGF